MKEIEIKLRFTMQELLKEGDKPELSFKNADVKAYGLQNAAENSIVNSEFVQIMAALKQRHKIPS